MVRAWGSDARPDVLCDRSRRIGASRSTNLEQCFPNRPARERRAIARATFAHFGQVLLKLLTFSALTPEQMLERAEYEGDERVRLAYAKGKGVLFFTGHFGFWECQAMAHAREAAADRRAGAVARQRAAERSARAHAHRRPATHVIYRQGAVRRVLKTLAAGEGVALLIDQHMHSPDAIWVNFFRRPAATTSTLAALALRTGAAVIPVFAHAAAGRALSIHLRIAGRAAAKATDPTRFASSRSAAPTCSRCTCARSRSCGCGCTGGGATRRCPTRRACFRKRRTKTSHESKTAIRSGDARLVVIAPNWLGDAVMALPALADLRRHYPSAHLAVAARAVGGAAVHDGRRASTR